MVSLVTKKWSHFSTESMFDLTETVLNVSSWAAGITPLFLFLVMSINHFITKAISAINFSALCEVDAQWYKLHFGVWATWNVGGSNHKSQMYMVWCHGTLLKGDACLAKAELSMVGIYQVDQTTRWTPKVTIFWVEFSSKETAWKRIHLTVVYGRHFSKTTNRARWIEQSEWSLTCSPSFFVNCTQQTLSNEIIIPT